MCVTLLIGWCIWTCSVSVRDCLSTLSWNVRCLFSVWLWIFFFSFHQSYGIAKSSGQPLWLPLLNQQLSAIYFFLYLVSLTVLSVSDIQITHETWETLDTVYLTDSVFATGNEVWSLLQLKKFVAQVFLWIFKKSAW